MNTDVEWPRFRSYQQWALCGRTNSVFFFLKLRNTSLQLGIIMTNTGVMRPFKFCSQMQWCAPPTEDADVVVICTSTSIFWILRNRDFGSFLWWFCKVFALSAAQNLTYCIEVLFQQNMRKWRCINMFPLIETINELQASILKNRYVNLHLKSNGAIYWHFSSDLVFLFVLTATLLNTVAKNIHISSVTLIPTWIFLKTRLIFLYWWSENYYCHNKILKYSTLVLA